MIDDALFGGIAIQQRKNTKLERNAEKFKKIL